MATRWVEEPDSILAELQRAVQDHERILQRQEELIIRLRNELKGVSTDERPSDEQS